MPVTKEHILEVVAEYCRAETEKDKDAWLGLFADDATHEDPVGGGHVNQGREALGGQLWDTIVAFEIELWCDGPVVVCGTEAVAVMQGRMGSGDSRFGMDRIVDHFMFDEDGKIKALRAFWSL